VRPPRFQEHAKPPALGIAVLEVPFLEQLREVRLRHVARVLGVDSLAAHENVERVPVHLAQLLEREARRLGRRIARSEHLRPACRDPPHVLVPETGT
jgi:hypothetical protein